MNHKFYQLCHSQARAKERFGINLTIAENIILANKIRDGKAKFVSRSSPRRTIWDLTLSTGELARVVYDSKNRIIVTCYKPNSQLSTTK